MNHADINFYFDPLCPFAWMTSKWVRQVAAQRDYTVDWRFISLRMINNDVDYDSRFPAGYEAGHTAGLRLLRVAARTRAEHGRQAVGPLYEAIGTQAFDSTAAPAPGPEERGSREFVEPLLEQAGLPARLASALDDASWDGELRAETDEALALTGKDVGTPIIHFGPPRGTAFFGPVISRAAQWRGGDPAVGPRSRARLLPRLRRAQAQPARTTPAPQLRRQPRRDRQPGGLARRKPTSQEIGPAAHPPLPERPRLYPRSLSRRTS